MTLRFRRTTFLVCLPCLFTACGQSAPTDVPAREDPWRDMNHPPRILVSSPWQVAPAPDVAYSFWVQGIEDEDGATGIRDLTMLGGDVTVTGTDNFRFTQSLPHMAGVRGTDTVRVSGLRAGGSYSAFARVWDGYDTTTGTTAWTVPGGG